MNVIKEELPNWQVRLTITIPALDVQKLKKDVIDDFSKQARLPGFRKGKVPPSLIESRYSKLIHEELTERLIEEFTSTAIQQTEFIPIDNLNVHNSQFSVNGDFHFVVNFYSFPIIPIPDYHNHTVTLPEFPITPDLVQNSINSILTQYADYQPVEDRPLQLDDFAVINLSTSLDSSSLNLPPHEIPNFLRPQQNLWLHITNSNTPVSQIAQNLIGLQPGQSKSFSLTFSPAQVPAPLSNQPITFTIELLAIQKRIIPPLTDEIVKKISPNHTAESFRDHISQILQKKAKDYLYYLKLNKIIEFLLPYAPQDIPNPILNKYTQFYLDNFIPSLIKETPEDQIDEKKLIQETQTFCRNRISFDCLIYRISKIENITLDQKDLYQQYLLFRSQSSLSEKAALKRFRSPHVYFIARKNALRFKVINFLEKNVKEQFVPKPNSHDPNTSSQPLSTETTSISPQTKFLLQPEPFPLT